MLAWWRALWRRLVKLSELRGLGQDKTQPRPWASFGSVSAGEYQGNVTVNTGGFTEDLRSPGNVQTTSVTRRCPSRQGRWEASRPWNQSPRVWESALFFPRNPEEFLISPAPFSIFSGARIVDARPLLDTQGPWSEWGMRRGTRS